jgi:hypothetical protein
MNRPPVMARDFAVGDRDAARCEELGRYRNSDQRSHRRVRAAFAEQRPLEPA